MRYILPIILFLCVTFGVAAKKNRPRPEHPRAEVKVSYDYYKKFLYMGGEQIGERTIPMVLLANSTQSKFYCPDTQFKDSMESSPSGRAIRNKLLSDWAKRDNETGSHLVRDNYAYKIQLYVYKDNKHNNVSVFDRCGLMEYGTYTEPLDVLTWEIGDSIKTIMGYDCINAETDYHGRHWTAYFTPEIPITEGPWKLCGLPGLILEASEPTGQHHFIVTGIEKSDIEMTPMIWECHKYDKMSRLDMLKSYNSFIHNGNSMVKASTGLDFGQDGAPTEETAKIDFLETDYH